MKSLRKILIVAGAFSPSSVFACAACFGRSDSPLAGALNWGIFTLLGVVVTVLTCIAVFFIHVVRREEAANDDTTPKNPPDA